MYDQPFTSIFALPIPIWMKKNQSLFSTLLPPSPCFLSNPLHAGFVKPFSSSTPLNLKALIVSQLQFLNHVPLNSPLFSTGSFSFPTLLVYFRLFGNLPMFSLSPKRGKSDLSNYRAIGITSLISKTMETIINKQLLACLETNNLLFYHQYDFQQARSTGDLLAYAVHS